MGEIQVIPPALERVVRSFSSLPGIGAKTATRLALTILRKPASEAREMAAALSELHGAIRLCSQCMAFSETDPCSVCGDPRRDSSLVCVVEQPADLLAIEKTDHYRGHYHILHGVLSPVDGIGPTELKVKELIARLDAGSIQEVLIAADQAGLWHPHGHGHQIRGSAHPGQGHRKPFRGTLIPTICNDHRN